MKAPVADLVTDPAGVAGLEAEWGALWRRAGTRTTPFQSPAWLLAWWRAFGTDRPVIATVRDRERLIGILPAYLLREHDGDKLLPIGAGTTDYLDALIDPDAPPDTAARLLGEALAATDSDRCDLIDLPPGAALREAPQPPGWRSRLSDGASCPVLDLHHPAGGFGTVVPAPIRRKLRMNRHRATRAGGCTVRFAAGRAEAADMLRCLHGLHRARWATEGQPGGVLADPLVEACQADAAPALVASRAAWLVTLTIGDDPAPAAGCLALADAERLFLYLSGFSAARAFESPGTLLLGVLIESAIERGLREVHFLRGAEPYKYAWGAVDRLNATRCLTRAIPGT